MKITLVLSLIICFGISAFSQEGVTLKEKHKLYLKGNSILIGNNILGHHKNKALVEDDIPNDKVKMVYIDVDNDSSTFSSSEATIRKEFENPKIAYAALYWSALYPFKKGVSKTMGNRIAYQGRGNREDNVNDILFKTPNGAYKNIKGEIIFDSFKTKSFEDNMPYVCYADVTSQLQEMSDIDGVYAVANVRATEGQISGGGSAGWLLYIVYEDEAESLKYFTTYDGLREVNRNAEEISFEGFKNKEEGNIKTSIAISTLEGDRKIKSDAVSIFHEKSNSYDPLSNGLREENNFFNSSITIGDKLFLNRNPNSTNTLGFDLLKMEIPNDDNNLFDNSTTSAKLKFETRADRFYLYFVAFETEVSQDYHQPEINLLANREVLVDSSIVSDLKKVQKDSTSSTRTQAIKESASIVSAKDSLKMPEETLVDKNLLVEQEDFNKEVLKRATITVPGMDPGYYLVTNVFSVEENAKVWAEFLEKNNFKPKSFINPQNTWRYIYITNSIDSNSVFKKWQEYKNLDIFKEIWVMRINL